MVARNSAKAKYRDIAQGTCEHIWIQRLMANLNMLVIGLMKLFSDSKSVISVVLTQFNMIG